MVKDCEQSTADAIKKAEEVVEFSKPFFELEPYTTYTKACEGIKAIAVKFNGEYWNTGGGCMCTVIPFDKYHCIGVSEECIVLYRSEEPRDDAYTIFFESADWENPFSYHYKIPGGEE